LYWFALFLLVGIGVGTTVNRILSLRTGVLVFNPIRSSLSSTTLQDIEKYDRTFITHPGLTLLHTVAGSIFILLALFQFSSRIRKRHIGFHRWSGRLIVLIALVSGLFGLLLAVPFRFTGRLSSSAAFIFGVFFLAAILRAYLAIRQHDVTRHQEWMIRAFSVAIGISVVRIAFGLLVLIGFNPTFPLLGISFWIGWILAVAAGEIWIRRNRLGLTSSEGVSWR
jgi:hypothetical protein